MAIFLNCYDNNINTRNQKIAKNDEVDDDGYEIVEISAGKDDVKSNLKTEYCSKIPEFEGKYNIPFLD